MGIKDAVGRDDELEYGEVGDLRLCYAMQCKTIIVIDIFYCRGARQEDPAVKDTNS